MNPGQTITKQRLQELAARLRASTPAPPVPVPSPLAPVLAPAPVPVSIHQTDKHGVPIEYNSNQLAFSAVANSGQSCVLIGAAGTGKTTSMKGTITSLLSNGKIGKLIPEYHKHLQLAQHGIVICAYTRRAVNKIGRAHV